MPRARATRIRRPAERLRSRKSVPVLAILPILLKMTATKADIEFQRNRYSDGSAAESSALNHPIRPFMANAASPGMNFHRLLTNPRAVVLAAIVTSGALAGCQTNVGGQTLPSAHYLTDDIQYFPAGPETPLPKAQKALDDYNAAAEQLAEDLEATR